jgi:hypothetical protein
MDEILHGCAAMGDQAFKLSVSLLEKLLEEATALYPYQASIPLNGAAPCGSG